MLVPSLFRRNVALVVLALKILINMELAPVLVLKKKIGRIVLVVLLVVNIFR